MTWSILDAASLSDRQTWLQLWNAWPGREVAAHPGYVQLYAEPGQRVLCATFTSGAHTVLFPFIARRLAEEPWAGGLEGWDLESPYGYGGPYWWGDRTGDVEAFWKGFDEWAFDSGVIAGFARLSLFPQDVAPVLRGEVVTTQRNIVRDLALDDEGLLRDYEHKVRKNVKRALANGVAVEFETDDSRLQQFMSIYNATLDRRSAADRYYFQQDFFQRLCRDLPGHYVFAHATVEGRVVSTELVLLSATHAYSFLGGTLSDSFHLRPNDLLKHEIARWARDHGKTDYVLGGGYGGQDGIYRYKRSFAPSGERDFRVWRYVVDKASFDRMGSMRQRYESARGKLTWEPRTGFFPPYRS